MEKLICAQCKKEDFTSCIIKDGKTFCCAVCSQKYAEEHADTEKEKDEEGVCKFC